MGSLGQLHDNYAEKLNKTSMFLNKMRLHEPSLVRLRNKVINYTRRPWLKDLENNLSFSKYREADEYSNNVNKKITEVDSTAEELEKPIEDLETRLNGLLYRIKDPSLDYSGSIRQFIKDNGKLECLDLIRHKTKLGEILRSASSSSKIMYDFIIEFVSNNPAILKDANPIAEKRQKIIQYDKAIQKTLDRYQMVLGEIKSMDRENWERRI